MHEERATPSRARDSRHRGVSYAVASAMPADVTSPADDPKPDPSDGAAALVRRIEAGDLRAEEDLVEQFSRGVTVLLRRLARDASLVDDLHQETFRTVLERIRGGAIREPEKISGFLCSTARNLFLVYRRKAARFREVDDIEATVDSAHHRSSVEEPAPLRRVLQEENALHVRRLLGELRHERDRQLLIRFYLSDQSPEEICADLDIEPQRLRKVMHRARQRLRQLVERARKRQHLTRKAT